MNHIALIRAPQACHCGDHGFINLTRGAITLIDVDDVSHCSKKKWNAQSRGHGVYARSTCAGSREYLHRHIMRAAPNQIVDHINRDTLDNRKANLRFVTPTESMFNTVCPNKTGYKGVRRYSRGYWAEIGSGKSKRSLGCFNTPEEAAVAFDIAAEASKKPRHTNTSLGFISHLFREKIGTPIPRKRGS